jgi:hypothetical protein
MFLIFEIMMETFFSVSEIMLVEAKALAQMQCAEAIMQSDNVCALHTDGTKRDGPAFGHKPHVQYLYIPPLEM